MFESLETLYDHIEKEAFGYRYLIEVGSLFQRLSDFLVSKNDQEQATLAQYEVDAHHLLNVKGRLVAHSTRTDDDGNEFPFPDIAKFSAEECDYFAERLGQTHNPRLKARYAHTLWESPKKHKQYAGFAIESYLKQVEHYEGLMQAHGESGSSESTHYKRVSKCCESALCLAVSSRQQIDDVVSEVFRLIQASRSDSQVYCSPLVTVCL